MHERLMDGVTSLLSENGWDAVNAFAISKAAGTSTRPAYDRFPERSMVAVAFWNSRAKETLNKQLVPLWRQVAGFVDGDVTNFLAGCEFILSPSPEADGLTELLLAAAFEEGLRGRITEHFEELLVAATGTASPTDIDRARSLYSWSLIIGLLVSNRRLHCRASEAATFLAMVAERLKVPADPSQLPDDRAEFMALQVIQTGDPVRDAFLNATLTGIATNGYRATTFESITRDASVSEGAIFSRYKDKMTILLEIIERRQREAIQAGVDFQRELMAKYETPIVNAISFREVFRPENRPAVNLAAEVERLARQDSRLLARINAAVAVIIEDATASLSETDRMAMEGQLNLALALGVGTQTMALFTEDGWKLPFDAVTGAVAR